MRRLAWRQLVSDGGNAASVGSARPEGVALRFLRRLAPAQRDRRAESFRVLTEHRQPLVSRQLLGIAGTGPKRGRRTRIEFLRRVCQRLVRSNAGLDS